MAEATQEIGGALQGRLDLGVDGPAGDGLGGPGNAQATRCAAHLVQEGPRLGWSWVGTVGLGRIGGVHHGGAVAHRAGDHVVDHEAGGVVEAVRQVAPGLLPGLVEGGVDHGVQRGVVALDDGDGGVDGLQGRGLPLADGLGQAKAVEAAGADWLHLYTEAARLAFADRAQFVGDPQFVNAPEGGWASLLDDAYLASRAKLIDPKRAQAMLGHLDGYLRATLATTRNDRGTLAEEFALLRGYLEILAIRMGPRLAYELDLPEGLASTTVPPMLLQPLVENAIKHGLEPKVDGGRVRVSARAEGRVLVLMVEDTGLGFGVGATGGTGVGLPNVRERLAALYSGAASLETGENPGGGVRVTLRLPIQT